MKLLSCAFFKKKTNKQTIVLGLKTGFNNTLTVLIHPYITQSYHI